MNISDECTEELGKKGFKEFRINGQLNFVNARAKAGFEIKNNHMNPWIMQEDGEKIFNPNNVPNYLEDAMNIFVNLEGHIPTHEETKIPDLPQNEIEIFIPETGIVPQNLTNELIEKHPGTIEVLLSMQQTNPDEIQTRPGPAGTIVRYVSGDYMQRCLNYASLFDWDFEVVESREDFIDDKTHFSVFGKLTVRTTEGKTISKTQWGSQILKAGQEVGDALKGATTDSLKKCASMLGIARDVYGGDI